MTTRKAAVEDSGRDEVLAHPPADFIYPGGGRNENREAVRLWWEIQVRGGLADKLAGLIAPRRQLVDNIRLSIRIARASLDGFTRDANQARLMQIEPALLEDEEWLKACAAWVGYLPGLKQQLAEAESKLAVVEGKANDLEAAVRVVQGAEADAEGAARLKETHGTVARGMAARVGAARKAVDEARALLRENESAIAAAEAKLETVRSRKAS